MIEPQNIPSVMPNSTATGASPSLPTLDTTTAVGQTNSSGGKFSKFQFVKNKQKLKVILPILVMFLVVAAVASGMVLVQTSQDVRQQASGGGPNYSCGTGDGLFSSSVPNSHSCLWAGAPYYKCNSGYNNSGGGCVSSSALASSQPNSTTGPNYSCGTGYGLFTDQVANSNSCKWDGETYYKCNSGYHNANNGCVPNAGTVNPSAQPRVSPVPSGMPSIGGVSPSIRPSSFPSSFPSSSPTQSTSPYGQPGPCTGVVFGYPEAGTTPCTDSQGELGYDCPEELFNDAGTCGIIIRLPSPSPLALASARPSAFPSLSPTTSPSPLVFASPTSITQQGGCFDPVPGSISCAPRGAGSNNSGNCWSSEASCLDYYASQTVGFNVQNVTVVTSSSGTGSLSGGSLIGIEE